MNLTEMELKRRIEIAAHAGANDTAFLRSLGGMEQYDWHEARKLVDASHINPYSRADRRQ